MKKSKLVYFSLEIIQVIIYLLIFSYFSGLCESDFETFSTIFVLGFGYYITIFVSNALHELGHLIGGLCTKYDFFMYSVGGLSIYKSDDNKYKFTKTNIAGAGGFVSMIPNANGNYRIFLYGGITVNLIIALICIGLLFCVSMIQIKAFLAVTILYNIHSFILNYCPIQVGNLSTDGMKIKDLDDEIYKLDEFIKQSKFDKILLLGIDYKDVDYDNFNLPSKMETFYEKNDFSQYLGKLIRDDRFEDAIKTINDYNLKINFKSDNIFDLDVNYETIFLNLMLDKVENIGEIFTKENINFMIRHRSQLIFSANRCLYIYYLLKKDEKNIKKTLKFKETMLRKTFKAQILYENHLYELIDKKFKNN